MSLALIASLLAVPASDPRLARDGLPISVIEWLMLDDRASLHAALK